MTGFTFLHFGDLLGGNMLPVATASLACISKWNELLTACPWQLWMQGG